MYRAALTLSHRDRNTGFENTTTELLLATVRADAAGRNRRTVVEPLERQKRKRRLDMEAKSVGLEIDGNAAFVKGDFKTAYILYTAAAVALKLKLYNIAIEDASNVIEEEDYNTRILKIPYFRRGQGWYFLGDWDKAEEDCSKALMLKPGDPKIVREIEELKRLRSLSSNADGRVYGVPEEAKVTFLDVFELAEFKRQTEELVGRSLDYIY
ncbi:hypothetical protein C8R44DRAFT_866765 [Mycena epipterygia]|nr:hypothetical protein C8R44DRAFT_866765 [Mycena epipterygia]